MIDPRRVQCSLQRQSCFHSHSTLKPNQTAELHRTDQPFPLCFHCTERWLKSYIVRWTTASCRAASMVFLWLTFEKVIYARSDVGPPRVLLIRAETFCTMLLRMTSCPGASIVRSTFLQPRRCRSPESLADTFEPSCRILLKPSQLVLHSACCSERGQCIDALPLPLCDNRTKKCAKVDAARRVSVRTPKHVGKRTVPCPEVVGQVGVGVHRERALIGSCSCSCSTSCLRRSVWTSAFVSSRGRGVTGRDEVWELRVKRIHQWTERVELAKEAFSTRHCARAIDRIGVVGPPRPHCNERADDGAPFDTEPR